MKQGNNLYGLYFCLDYKDIPGQKFKVSNDFIN